MFNFEENDYTQQQFNRVYPEVKESVTAGIMPEDRKCTIILGKEYERDFIQRKIDILSDRAKKLDRDDYDER